MNSIANNPINLGQFHPYSNDTVIETGDSNRVIKCCYKGDKVENAYVCIPDHITSETVHNNYDELMPYFVRFLQEQEDTMIKADHKKGLLSVETEYLSIDKIIDYMERVKPLAKIDKKSVEDWFNENIAASLGDLLEEKDIPADKQQPYIIQYLNKFISVLSSKSKLEEADKKSLKELMIFCGVEESKIGSALVSMIDKREEKEVELLPSLFG